MLLEKTLHHAFPARADGCFTLDADSGSITVGPGEGDEIQVDVTVATQALDEAVARELQESVVVEFLTTGTGPLVRSRAAKAERSAWNFWRRKGQVELTFAVTIPYRQDLVINSVAGDVEITRIQGNVRVYLGAGAIHVGAVTGRVSVETGSGPIEVRQVGERVIARSNAGNIKLLQIGDAIEVTTGAGEVSAEIVRQPTTDSRITTSTGGVSIDLAETVGLYLDATTRIGGVMTRPPSAVRASPLGGSICAPINGGGPRLTVRTDVGEVFVRSFSRLD